MPHRLQIKKRLSKMTPGGYVGKILRVNLSNRSVSEEIPSPQVLKDYIGGSGLGTKILFNEVSAHVNPFDYENRLIFTTGPLTGTLIPGSGTYAVSTRSPLTGLAGIAHANGFFGARLKYAGYDGIIFQGASENLVYLLISNGKVELRDASDLAGKDTSETEDILQRRHGEERMDFRTSVASIGPAGERLVRFSAIFSDRGHVAASGGVGAVMGSKRLKAIVVQGRGGVKPSAEKKEVKEVLRDWIIEARESSLGKIISTQGSVGLFLPYYSRGWVPVKNLTTNLFPNPEVFDGAYLRKKFFKMKPRSCHACTLHHCHIVEVLEGPFKGFVGEEPEFEIFAGFGPNLGIYEPGAITKLNNVNDRLGMDAKEVAFLLSLTIECYEKGLLKKKDLDGIELRWGDVFAIENLMKRIANRQGIGDLLAEGTMRTAQWIGGEALNIAVYVKQGNSPHIHDPRTKWGGLFTQAVSNMGSQEGIDMTLKSSKELGINEPTSLPTDMVGKAQAKTGPKRQFEECLIFCYYQTPSLPTLVRALNSITGFKFTVDECLTLGRRVINLLRVFNIRHGFSVDQDSFSPRLGEPPLDGPGKGQSLAPAFEEIKRCYYKEMGWDERTGFPFQATLQELGLEEAAQELKEYR
jgi:aldehyde:ferredoxin oxidoreductase